LPLRAFRLQDALLARFLRICAEQVRKRAEIPSGLDTVVLVKRLSELLTRRPPAPVVSPTVFLYSNASEGNQIISRISNVSGRNTMRNLFRAIQVSYPSSDL
jgi:hypothetical protein